MGSRRRGVVLFLVHADARDQSGHGFDLLVHFHEIALELGNFFAGIIPRLPVSLLGIPFGKRNSLLGRSSFSETFFVFHELLLAWKRQDACVNGSKRLLKVHHGGGGIGSDAFFVAREHAEDVFFAIFVQELDFSWKGSNACTCRAE